MGRPADPVVIGVVVAPHGVRGTVRVRATGSGRHLREGVEPFVGGARRFILGSRPTPKGFLVDLEGVGGRSGAADLRGEELALDRGELDAPEEGEFYADDLVGLRAVDDSGSFVGVVAETLATPAHEVLVLRLDAEKRAGSEVYVPFTLEHVPGVDLDEGRLTVRPPEG